MVGQERYLAFISYSHVDRASALALRAAIEGYAVPRRLVGRRTDRGAVPARPRPIFVDRDELPASGDLTTSVRAALVRSDALIVILSPAAAASRWVEQELVEFKRHRPGAPVFAALLPEPVGDGPIDPATIMPRALRCAVEPDGAIGAPVIEPLAADFRPQADGAHLGLLKLVAGLIDVPLNELVKREHQRHHGRLAAAAALSAAAVVVLAALLSFAIGARNDARAERARAEEMVEFMLGDLRGRLEPVGRLDALDAVGRQVLDYYARDRRLDEDPAALGRRARALLLVGEIRNRRGDSAAALVAFREAATTTAELARRFPDDGGRLYDHAQSVFWIGLIDWQRGDIQAAETAFRDYDAIARRLVAIDPAKPEWQAESGHGAINLGAVLVEQGRGDDAADAFTRAATLFGRLSRAQPADPQWLPLYAQAQAWLADAERMRGRLDAAWAARTAERAIYVTGLKRAADDAALLEPLVNADVALSQLALDRGDAAAAVRLADRAAAGSARLTAIDPSNLDWRSGRVQPLLAGAEARLATGNLDGAAAQILAAGAIADSLVAADPTRAEWRLEQQRVRLLDGERAMRAGAVVRARQLAQAVLGATDRLAAPAPLVLDLRSRSWLLLAAASAAGSRERAGHLRALQGALTPVADRLDLKGRCWLALGYAGLGRTGDARLIAAELGQAGFRHPACRGLPASPTVAPIAATTL